MEDNFLKADSGNLPKLDSIMVVEFFKSNPDFCSAEFRNVKTSTSARQSYGDDAVGYVQLRRERNICTLKCKISPEHKVRSKSYNVTLIVNEEDDQVDSCKCHDCPASEGGCKHAVAFLMWVHRRSEEPPCTSVECYWRKPTLSKVGTSIKYITAQEMSKRSSTVTIPQETLAGASSSYDASNALLSQFLLNAKKHNLKHCQLVKHFDDEIENLKQISLHSLLWQLNEQHKLNYADFLSLVSTTLISSKLKRVEEETRDQHKNTLWHELRYGRITASKAYQVSRCKTPDGAMVAAIMGARFPGTLAMKRGIMLEEAVRQSVEKQLGVKINQCGLFLSKDHPMLAASPDGICNKGLIEIKCPTSAKTSNTYIENEKITNKYEAQVQLQMFLANKQKCYFCVADHNYETNESVKIIEIEFNEAYCKDLLKVLEVFWKVNIFPLLCKVVKN